MLDVSGTTSQAFSFVKVMISTLISSRNKLYLVHSLRSAIFDCLSHLP